MFRLTLALIIMVCSGDDWIDNVSDALGDATKFGELSNFITKYVDLEELGKKVSKQFKCGRRELLESLSPEERYKFEKAEFDLEQDRDNFMSLTDTVSKKEYQEIRRSLVAQHADFDKMLPKEAGKEPRMQESNQPRERRVLGRRRRRRRRRGGLFRSIGRGISGATRRLGRGAKDLVNNIGGEVKSWKIGRKLKNTFKNAKEELAERAKKLADGAKKLAKSLKEWLGCWAKALKDFGGWVKERFEKAGSGKGLTNMKNKISGVVQKFESTMETLQKVDFIEAMTEVKDKLKNSASKGMKDFKQALGIGRRSLQANGEMEVGSSDSDSVSSDLSDFDEESALGGGSYSGSGYQHYKWDGTIELTYTFQLAVVGAVQFNYGWVFCANEKRGCHKDGTHGTIWSWNLGIKSNVAADLGVEVVFLHNKESAHGAHGTFGFGFEVPFELIASIGGGTGRRELPVAPVVQADKDDSDDEEEDRRRLHAGIGFDFILLHGLGSHTYVLGLGFKIAISAGYLPGAVEWLYGQHTCNWCVKDGEAHTEEALALEGLEKNVELSATESTDTNWSFYAVVALALINIVIGFFMYRMRRKSGEDYHTVLLTETLKNVDEI